ncbi:hypothetical protein V7148_18585 [Gottfriedia acidiceleris]|uniref:hypothetical protein n=1 Tax=Bacillaceae TaxID=186817 RepID=UPI000BEE7D65|nr:MULTISPECIES: hypothetical protein [unclassified Bacillus (in: firmicutes)]PEC48722.1 hypothetical protein CON00_14160 [Bacillus sp. AFS096315]PFM82741.1 hypothetical protein COJ46_02730 [Bacillus sp. AFS077874]
MKKIIPVLLLILVIFTGCNSDTIYTPLYHGKNLMIGVIGKFPKVREENVKFKKINFKDVYTQIFNTIDSGKCFND